MFFFYINELCSLVLVADIPAFIVTTKPLGIMRVMVQVLAGRKNCLLLKENAGVFIQFHEMENKNVHFKILRSQSQSQCQC